MKSAFAAAIVATLSVAPASAAVLTTGPGDGGVTVEVTASGTASGTGDYHPVGGQGPASTIYFSDLLFRTGSDGTRQSIANGTVLSESMSGASYISPLGFGAGLSVTVTQSLTSLFASDGVTRTGSLLQQSYDFDNLGASDLVLDLVRYLDGDLYFDGGRADGGGVLTTGGRTILFETDSETNASDFATFVGIFNEGGTPGGFEIGDYSAVYYRMSDGRAPTNLIGGDTDGDGFVDARYDLGLAQQSSLAVDAGGRNRFSTFTLFGSGVPNAVEVPGAVPEPATWAMMIGGFGLVGNAMRRRPTLVTA